MRVIKDISLRTRNGEIVYLDIPHIGLFVSKKNVVGVQFHDHLIADTKVILLMVFLIYLRLY